MRSNKTDQQSLHEKAFWTAVQTLHTTQQMTNNTLT